MTVADSNGNVRATADAELSAIQDHADASIQAACMGNTTKTLVPASLHAGSNPNNLVLTVKPMPVSASGTEVEFTMPQEFTVSSGAPTACTATCNSNTSAPISTGATVVAGNTITIPFHAVCACTTATTCTAVFTCTNIKVPVVAQGSQTDLIVLQRTTDTGVVNHYSNMFVLSAITNANAPAPNGPFGSVTRSLVPSLTVRSAAGNAVLTINPLGPAGKAATAETKLVMARR